MLKSTDTKSQERLISRFLGLEDGEVALVLVDQTERDSGNSASADAMSGTEFELEELEEGLSRGSSRLRVCSVSSISSVSEESPSMTNTGRGSSISKPRPTFGVAHPT